MTKTHFHETMYWPAKGYMLFIAITGHIGQMYRPRTRTKWLGIRMSSSQTTREGDKKRGLVQMELALLKRPLHPWCMLPQWKLLHRTPFMQNFHHCYSILWLSLLAVHRQFHLITVLVCHILHYPYKLPWTVNPMNYPQQSITFSHDELLKTSH